MNSTVHTSREHSSIRQEPPDLHSGFHLNGLQVLPATGQVFLASGWQTLEPKVMAVLLVLVRAAGQPVSTEQIFAAVWPRSVYSPMQVRRSINQLRKVLQDADKTLIRTHPKRGYLLDASIVPLANHAETAVASLPFAGHHSAGHHSAGHQLAAGGEPGSITRMQQSGVTRQRAALMQPVLLMLLIGILIACGWWFRQSQATTSFFQVSALRPLASSAADESFSQFTPDSTAVVYLKTVTKGTDQHASSSELWLAPLDGQPHRLLWQSALPLQFFSFMPLAEHQQSADANPAETHTVDTDAAQARAGDGRVQLMLASEQDGQLQFSKLSLDLSLHAGQPMAAELSAPTQSASAQSATASSATAQAAQPELTPVLSLPDSQLRGPFFIRNNQLYMLLRQSAGIRLMQADLTNGQLSLLAAATDQFTPYRIAAAPPQQIALLGFDQQQRSQMKWLHSATGRLTDLQTLDHNWYFMAYDEARAGYLLSDGKRLFYLANNQALQPLAFENTDFLHYPTLSPDGRHISYTHTRLQGNLFRQQLPAGQPQQLTQSSRHDWQGRYSPDGKQIAYVSNNNGHSQMFVLDLPTGQHRLVYANPSQQLALSQPVWSPDGQQLAFARNQQLVLVQLTGRQPQVEYLDELIGQPSQWLAQPSRLLLKQAGQPMSRWLWYDVLTRQQQLLVSSGQTQLWCAQHWFALDERQLRLMQSATPGSRQPMPTTAAEAGRPVFVAPAEQRIVQHLVSDAGIYLLLSQRTTLAATTQPNTSNSLWFIPLASLQADKIYDAVPTDVDLSDIYQQQLLYSTFHSAKDIQTLTFGPAL